VRILRAWWLISLLAGCAGQAPVQETPPDPRDAAWAARRALLAVHEKFTLNGRIAVQRDAEGAQVAIRWEQVGTAFDLRLIAPLGQGTYRLTGDTSLVTLMGPDGQSYQAPDLDSLMSTHLKWSMPVAGARFWVLGLPVPDRPTTQLTLDDQGRVSDLAQDGWRISVLEYQRVGVLDLPRRLFLLGRDLKIRLVITDWALPQS